MLPHWYSVLTFQVPILVMLSALKITFSRRRLPLNFGPHLSWIYLLCHQVGGFFSPSLFV